MHFGELFSERENLTDEEKIEQGKKFIEQIKRNNLGEKRNNIKEFIKIQNEDVQHSISNIMDKLKEQGMDIYTGDTTIVNEIIEKEQEEFRKNKLNKFLKEKNISQEQIENKMNSIYRKIENGNELDEEEQEIIDEVNVIGAESGKIATFGAKVIEMKEKTIDEITRKMKEALIRDLIENSKDSETPKFSDKVWDAYFGIKAANYDKLVKYSNFDFQTEIFPKAMCEMIKRCAESLEQSGAIRNKFYDKKIRALVKDENAKKCMKTKYKPEEKYITYRKEHGISDIKGRKSYSGSQYKGPKEQQKQFEMESLCGDLYRYVQDREETFADMYEDTYFAVGTKVRKKIEDWVLDPDLEKPEQAGDSKEVKQKKKDFSEHFYHTEIKKQVDEMRQEIINTYGSMELTQEQKEEYINRKIEEEHNDMEHKMALQLSVKYFAQMTDRSFEDIGIRTGYLPEDLRKNAKRGVIESRQANGYIDEIKGQQIPQTIILNTNGEER